MSFRNYDPKSLKPEANNMEYLNIPRTSLSVRELMERSLRGAPIDAVDISSSFDSSPDDENDFSTTPYMDDRVDVSEQADALSSRIRARATRRTRKSEEEQLDNVQSATTRQAGAGVSPEAGGATQQTE